LKNVHRASAAAGPLITELLCYTHALIMNESLSKDGWQGRGALLWKCRRARGVVVFDCVVCP